MTPLITEMVQLSPKQRDCFQGLQDMTETRKLLERCARVMGGLIYVEDCDGWIHVDAEGNRGAWWNPLTSRADAADMAIKMKVDVNWKHGEVWATHNGNGMWDATSNHPTEQAAYCWAICSVVAQMGGE